MSPRISPNNSNDRIINAINDALAQLGGQLKGNGFSKYRVDAILSDSPDLDDHYEVELSLGHTLATYPNWELFHDSPQYSIWKHLVVNYADAPENLLTFDGEDLDYRGEANSELFSTFQKVLLQHENLPTVLTYDGSSYTTRSGAFSLSLGSGEYLYIGFDYPSTSFLAAITVAGLYGALTWEYAASDPVGGITWETLAPTDGTSGLTASGNVRWPLNGDEGSTVVNGFPKYWIRVSAASETTEVEIEISSSFYDNSTEAASELGTVFPLPSTTGEKLYLGSPTKSSGASFILKRPAGNFTLKAKYFNGSSWVELLETTDSLDDDTDGFISDGNITWTLPSDQAQSEINYSTLYWIEITTTSSPTVVPLAYMIDIPTSVISLLRLSNTQINLKEWAWCYYDGYVYVTIRNTADASYEGDVYITGDSTPTNLQNFFVYNHEYQVNYLLSSFDVSVSCQNYVRRLNGVNSKLVVLDSSNVPVMTVDHYGNGVALSGVNSGVSSLHNGNGYGDYEVDLRDNSGRTKFYLYNSLNSGVMSIDSDGNWVLAGTLSPGGAPSTGTDDYSMKLLLASRHLVVRDCQGISITTVSESGVVNIAGGVTESGTP